MEQTILTVSPACAGMIPVWDCEKDEWVGEPRMRGDDPEVGDIKRSDIA